ncbi:unnamed protein product, partial [Clonostachys byssicola]
VTSAIMAPVGPVVVQNPISKMKRPPPPGIQTNGVVATTPSPSPSASAKKPPPSAKQPTPNPGVERNITTSTVRPVNRVRRDTITQLGRNSRNSTGLRSSSVVADPQGLDGGPRPYVVTDSYVLKRNAGKRPSLVVHLHPNHFRFDGQDSIFSYVSPMRMFLQHLKTRTIPHDILEYLVQANVPFYDGCLIVRVHDHKSTAKSQETARPTSSSNAPDPSSVHSRSQYLTPSPYVAFPKEGTVPTEETNPAEAEVIKEEAKEDKEKENSTSTTHQDGQKSKTPAKPKVYTLVLHPTSESLQRDLLIKATTPAGGDGRQTEGTNGVPPSTPMTLVPPTPTAATMPPPAKRQKKVKMELEPNHLAAAEGQILLATEAPLFLEPTKTLEEQIILLDAMAHPKHSGPPPEPKTRKRTVAEMAADEAAAAEQERYMLLLDERSGTTSAQNAGGTDSDAQNGATAFEPRFERFKVIADIKREHAEKKEQEKIKQQENDRRLQQQRLQQQQEQAQAAQKQQAEAAEKARREAAIRENHARQQSEAQRAAMAARAVQNTTPVAPPKQVSTPQNSAPTPHVHPQQNPIATNNMPNGGQVVPQQPPNAVQNAVMAGQAQARFPAQIQQQVVSAQSPIIRQGTPQNHSSPMVNNSVPMQQTSSAMAASPPRPSSVVQNPPMSVPMAHNMSARGSQQSHPSGTPRMPHSTPNMAHGTPISRPAMVATPRMTQASPPPNMMAQNSQMGQMMMMNNQNLAQQNPQLMAQFAAQRAMQQQQQQHLQQQQQHNMQGANLNGNMVAQMSPQQQQHMMAMMQQRQQYLAQQQQQQQQMQQQQGGMPTQQQLAQQYSQQLQNMQGNQMRQMTPQMQAQLQMARMQQQQAAQQAAAAQQQMGGNAMQRQVSSQMMNGNNANMQAMLQMQQQQQQAVQQQRQMSQQQQQQSPVQMQIHQTARSVFARMIQETTVKYGGREQVPEEVVNQVKAQSIQQAHMIVKNTIAQRQAAQQNQLLMQQQQQAMQGMGGMMGPQIAFSMHSSQLSPLVLSLLLAVSPASSTNILHCDNLVVDKHKFDLSALTGPHSVVTSRYNSIADNYHNTTYTLDICRPLKKTGSGKKGEECPNGTQVCAITRLLKDDVDTIDNVIAIAGALEDNGGTQFEYQATRLKTSDSNSDSQKEGVRLVLKGGREPLEGKDRRDQRAVIEFLCNSTMTGLEGEWRSEDRYDGDEFEQLGARDEKDDKGDEKSSSEHQLLNDGAALVWESYGADDAEKNVDTLRLTWYTKHACESKEDSGDDGRQNNNSHWGFFTWFIIIAFLGVSAYLIFGSWLNYTRYGARGWDLLPHGDTIRDIPYLLKDWTRQVLNTVQGTGSRGGYSAV